MPHATARPRTVAVHKRIDPGVLGTGRIATLCGVNTHTARRWIDRKELPGWVVPGTAERRARLEDVVRFARRHGIRSPRLEEAAAAAGVAANDLPAVLLVSTSQSYARALRSALGPDVTQAEDVFAAVELWCGRAFSCAVIDMHATGREEALRLTAWVKSRRPAALVVLLLAEDSSTLDGRRLPPGVRWLAQPACPRDVAGEVRGRLQLEHAGPCLNGNGNGHN